MSEANKNPTAVPETKKRDYTGLLELGFGLYLGNLFHWISLGAENEHRLLEHLYFENWTDLSYFGLENWADLADWWLLFCFNLHHLITNCTVHCLRCINQKNAQTKDQ